MEQELDQVVQAIAIAFDPAQISLHQQALAYIQSIQQNANETWRLALRLFVDQNPDGTRRYPTQARFWALRVLDDFLDNRFESFDNETFQTLQQALLGYVQSEYILGRAEADAPFLRNKFSHTFTLFFLCTYTEQWPTFLADLCSLVQSQTLNHHLSLLFFHIILEISGEVADQLIKSARTFSVERHARDGRVRDAVRDRDARKLNDAVLAIIGGGLDQMAKLRDAGELANQKELDDVVEVVDWGIRTFGSYVGWIDITLTVTPTTVPLLFTLLGDSSLPIRLATSVALLRIVSKGLKEHGDKLQLIKVLALGPVLDELEKRTRQKQIERGGVDTDEGEESYREALGKLLNALGQELVKLIEECPDESIRTQATALLMEIQPTLLRFLADIFDDTCSTVFPLLHMILAGYKRRRKISTVPLDDSKRQFLISLLEVILKKMKWAEDPSPDDADEDDIAEFEKMRKDLRGFLDSILSVEQDLVTDAIQRLAMDTINAYRSGTPVPWNTAELGVYLVYIFGEINKSGGKGRAAFCQAPAVDRDKRKGTDYSEYPLTSHGEMLLALVQSNIASFPNRSVSLQFYETAARYTDFFKVRKECIIPTLEAMMDQRGLHNENQQFRWRLFYLFYRFIKDLKAELPVDIVPTILNGMKDLLPIQAEIPELEEPEEDLLTEATKSSAFDSQLYLFETVGTLASLMNKTPDEQTAALSSLVTPLMDELSISFQAYRTNGPADILPIIKVHHIIMALGNIAKGYPDYPSNPTQDYMPGSMEVFAQMAQAILVCLEAMNVFRPLRDATRFAFARILATAGPRVTHAIPPLMSNLLAHFEPSELVDFMNFIGLLVHKLQQDMFDTLDQLIGPLSAHITNTLSQPTSGTDDQRSQTETKKAYLALLNNVLASQTNLFTIFTSERNSPQFESLLGSMESIAEDVADPASQRVALTFLTRGVVVWGQPLNGSTTYPPVPGFDRFIYEQLIPRVFQIPARPGFNIKDGQMLVVLQEIANLLQSVCTVRGEEAYNFFLNNFLPSQNWPSDMIVDFTTKMRTLEGRLFRKYFTDLIRSSQQPRTS